MTSGGASTDAMSVESRMSTDPVLGWAGAFGRGGIPSSPVAGLAVGKSNGESPGAGRLGAAGGLVRGFVSRSGFTGAGLSRLNGLSESLGNGTGRGTASP
jgi:hypothetical protein